jgi:hypothetical protein
VGGVRLDEVTGIDVLDGPRSRGRHPAVVLPFAAAFLRKEQVRRALRQLRGGRVLRRRASGVTAEVTYTGGCTSTPKLITE